MKNLITILFIIISLQCIAQQELKINLPTPANVSIYVPQNITGKVPAFIFIPGLGEQNTDISGLYKNGSMLFIKNGWKPDFIVAGIQPPQGWPDGWFIHYMIDSLIARGFPIDKRLIILTGLSAGANCIYSYMELLPSNPAWFKPVAIVPMSYPVYTINEAWHYLPAWGFCGNADFPLDNMKTSWQTMNTNGWTNKRFTIYQGDHCCWWAYYDPTYKESFSNGQMSIYDWGVLMAKTNVILPIRDTAGQIPHIVAPEIFNAEVFDYSGRLLFKKYNVALKQLKESLQTKKYFIIKYWNGKTFGTEKIFKN